MDDILLEDLIASPNHAHDQQSLEASAEPRSTTAFDPVPVIPFDLPNHIVRPHAGECQCLWCWRPMLSLSHQDQSPELKKRWLEFTFQRPENAFPGPELNIGAPGPFTPNTTLPSASADESYGWHLFPSKRLPSGVYTARTLSLATNLVPVLVYTPSRSRSPSAVEENPTLWRMSEEASYEEQRTDALEEGEEEEREEREEGEEEEEYDYDLLSAYPQAYQDYLEESIGSVGSSTLREVNEGASNSDDDGDGDGDGDDCSVASTAVKSTPSLAREDAMLEQKESPRPSADSISTTPLPPPPALPADPSRWSESTEPSTPSSPVRPNDTDYDGDGDDDDDDDEKSNANEHDEEGGRVESPIVPMHLWQWPQHERFLDPRTPTPTPPTLPRLSSPTATATLPAIPAPRPVSDARASLVARCGSAGGGGGGGGGRRRAGFRPGVRNVWGKLIGGVRRRGS